MDDRFRCYRACAWTEIEWQVPAAAAVRLPIQALFFARVYPKLFAADRKPWLRGAMGFGCVFALLAWSFAVLPVAAKYRMASVQDFPILETAFTVLQFVIVSPLIALAYRAGASRSTPVAMA